MIGLLQRVSSAQVSINNHIVASIEAGLLLFIGIEKNDTEQQADDSWKKYWLIVFSRIRMTR